MHEQKSYEVIRLIEHDGRCRISMDYVKGELLVKELQRSPPIDKALLYKWFRCLAVQIEQYHRCRKHQCYRYLNPYSVLVTEEQSLLLLDMEAQSNAFVIKSMQQRVMREHFVKPIAGMKEENKTAIDLYSLGKTIQFILAHTVAEPSLSRIEEIRLSHIIQKCLGTNPKRKYENLKQVQKELRKTNVKKRHKSTGKIVIAAVILLTPLLGYQFLPFGQDDVPVETPLAVQEEKPAAEQSEQGQQTEEKKEQDRVQEETSADMNRIEEEMKALQKYAVQNTAEDNLRIIEKGEELQLELLAYLAAAYDREERNDEAIETYHLLCRKENRPEMLETVYLGKMRVEERAGKIQEAVQTGREGMELFTESEEIALAYIRAVCKSETEKEEVEHIVQSILDGMPQLHEHTEFAKLTAEFGLQGGESE